MSQQMQTTTTDSGMQTSSVSGTPVQSAQRGPSRRRLRGVSYEEGQEALAPTPEDSTSDAVADVVPGQSNNAVAVARPGDDLELRAAEEDASETLPADPGAGIALAFGEHYGASPENGAVSTSAAREEQNIGPTVESAAEEWKNETSKLSNDERMQGDSLDVIRETVGSRKLKLKKSEAAQAHLALRGFRLISAEARAVLREQLANNIATLTECALAHEGASESDANFYTGDTSSLIATLSSRDTWETTEESGVMRLENAIMMGLDAGLRHDIVQLAAHYDCQGRHPELFAKFSLGDSEHGVVPESEEFRGIGGVARRIGQGLDAVAQVGRDGNALDGVRLGHGIQTDGLELDEAQDVLGGNIVGIAEFSDTDGENDTINSGDLKFDPMRGSLWFSSPAMDLKWVNYQYGDMTFKAGHTVIRNLILEMRWPTHNAPDNASFISVMADGAEIGNLSVLTVGAMYNVNKVGVSGLRVQAAEVPADADKLRSRDAIRGVLANMQPIGSGIFGVIKSLAKRGRIVNEMSSVVGPLMGGPGGGTISFERVLLEGLSTSQGLFLESAEARDGRLDIERLPTRLAERLIAAYGPVYERHEASLARLEASPERSSAEEEQIVFLRAELARIGQKLSAATAAQSDSALAAQEERYLSLYRDLNSGGNATTGGQEELGRLEASLKERIDVLGGSFVMSAEDINVASDNGNTEVGHVVGQVNSGAIDRDSAEAGNTSLLEDADINLSGVRVTSANLGGGCPDYQGLAKERARLAEAETRTRVQDERLAEIDAKWRMPLEGGRTFGEVVEELCALRDEGAEHTDPVRAAEWQNQINRLESLLSTAPISTAQIDVSEVTAQYSASSRSSSGEFPGQIRLGFAGGVIQRFEVPSQYDAFASELDSLQQKPQRTPEEEERVTTLKEWFARFDALLEEADEVTASLADAREQLEKAAPAARAELQMRVDSMEIEYNALKGQLDALRTSVGAASVDVGTAELQAAGLGDIASEGVGLAGRKLDVSVKVPGVRASGLCYAASTTSIEAASASLENLTAQVQVGFEETVDENEHDRKGVSLSSLLIRSFTLGKVSGSQIAVKVPVGGELVEVEFPNAAVNQVELKEVSFPVRDFNPFELSGAASIESAQVELQAQICNYFEAHGQIETGHLGFEKVEAGGFALDFAGIDLADLGLDTGAIPENSLAASLRGLDATVRRIGSVDGQVAINANGAVGFSSTVGEVDVERLHYTAGAHELDIAGGAKLSSLSLNGSVKLNRDALDAFFKSPEKGAEVPQLIERIELSRMFVPIATVGDASYSNADKKLHGRLGAGTLHAIEVSGLVLDNFDQIDAQVSIALAEGRDIEGDIGHVLGAMFRGNLLSANADANATGIKLGYHKDRNGFRIDLDVASVAGEGRVDLTDEVSLDADGDGKDDVPFESPTGRRTAGARLDNVLATGISGSYGTDGMSFDMASFDADVEGDIDIEQWARGDSMVGDDGMSFQLPFLDTFDGGLRFNLPLPGSAITLDLPVVDGDLQATEAFLMSQLIPYKPILLALLPPPTAVDVAYTYLQIQAFALLFCGISDLIDAKWRQLRPAAERTLNSMFKPPDANCSGGVLEFEQFLDSRVAAVSGAMVSNLGGRSWMVDALAPSGHGLWPAVQDEFLQSVVGLYDPALAAAMEQEQQASRRAALAADFEASIKGILGFLGQTQVDLSAKAEGEAFVDKTTKVETRPFLSTNVAADISASGQLLPGVSIKIGNIALSNTRALLESGVATLESASVTGSGQAHGTLNHLGAETRGSGHVSARKASYRSGRDNAQ